MILLIKIKQHCDDLGVGGMKAYTGRSNALDRLQTIIDPITFLFPGKGDLLLKLKSMLHQVRLGKS
jgi:hypothetical protein